MVPRVAESHSEVPAAVVRRERQARILVLVYALATLLSAGAWLTRRWGTHHVRASWVELAFGVLNVPMAGSLVVVVVLAILTRALAGRKRVALVAVGGFEVVGILVGLASIFAVAQPFPWEIRELLGHVLNIVSMVVALAVLIWLVRLAPAFPGRVRPGSWLAGLVVLVAGTGVSLALTWLLLRPAAGARTRDRLLVTLLRSVGEEVGRGAPRVAPWLPDLLGGLLGVTLVVAVWVFVRSVRDPDQWTGSKEVQLRHLLAEHGEGDSLGYFATRRDKSTVFSPDGRAAVAYRVVQGVSLASGDPVGDPAAWPAAIDAWRDEARRYGWVPAATSMSAAAATALTHRGMSVIRMGDEAVLETDRFDLSTSSMTRVRHAVNHARGAGLTVRLRRQSALPAAELADLTDLGARWRTGDDRGFSMALNREADPADGRIVHVTAHTGDGAVVGLLSLVPWGRRGLSLDVMRRSPQAPGGVTELMVCELMDAAPGLGLRRVSLNFCMFRSTFEEATDLGASSATRLQGTVLKSLDRFFQLERLYRFNVKFGPDWHPRYLCYDQGVNLPATVAAVGIAEGFLPAWWAARLAGRRQLAPAELDAVTELENQPPPELPGPRRSDQTRHRLAAVERLAAAGRDPWPVGTGAPSSSAVVGRVRTIRDHGGVVFADLAVDGTVGQVLLEASVLGRDGVREFASLVSSGDLLEATGTAGVSRNGTPVLVVDGWSMLAKSLHPIPFRSFTDPQARLRQRSTDLIVNRDELGHLQARSRVVAAVRAQLGAEGYTEVETPILHTVHGGASARPFHTHINAYNMDLSLRIAPELYLKRLLVGGFGPLFELGRNFRNEGVDATHNPEFTSLEVYQPYGDYTTMRQLTERLVKAAARAVHGREELPLPGPDGAPVLTDVSGEWPVVRVLDAVSAAVGEQVTLATDIDLLLAFARRHEVHIADHMGPGAIIEELYADLVEAHTVRPTFYVDFPVETSPLTRPHRTDAGLVERWDLVVARMELGTAYSELTDPVEQRRRLTAQSLKAAAGDPEAMEVDEDFLFALECGMPPTGGMGLGVDRLVMLLTGTTIRSVLTFPFVKPRGR